MFDLAHSTFPVGFAIFNAVAMTIIATLVFLFHDRKREDIEQWIDYGFSAHTLRQVLIYYRGMAFFMMFFYVLFVLSIYLLQLAGYHELFVGGEAGPFSVAFFALDLVVRGALFDFMQHWDLTLSPIHMNRSHNFWFVFYCFVFRMFYALALFRMLTSFVWIYTKIRLIRRGQGPIG